MAGFSLETFVKQIDAESGGKQFNKDGSVVTSPKGAIGIGQIMPTTGPDAARFAGLPWDANRLRTDPDYNLALSKAYKIEMLKEFGGNERQATAAYNAGPTRIRNLINQHGAGWEAHIPGETKKYLGKVLGNGTTVMADSSSSNVNVREPVSTDWIQRALGEAPADAGMVGQVANPFGQIVSQIASAGRDTFSAAQTAQLGIAAENLKRDAVTDQAVEEIRAGAEFKGKVIDEQIATTQAALGTLKPMFAQRQATQDRIKKVTHMNPLARGFMSLFDRSYDLDSLRSDQREIQGDISLKADEFKNVLTLQETLTNLITQQTANHTSVFDAIMHDSDENIRAMASTISASETVLGAATKQLGAESQVQAAQSQARSSVLSQMTYSQAVAAQDKASRNGGFVNVNGATLSLGEIKQVTDNWERIDLNMQQARIGLQSAQMGLERGGMALKEEKEKDTLSRLPMNVLLEIGKNGGNYQGYQFDMGNVGAAIQTRTAANQVTGAVLGQQNAPQVAGDLIRNFAAINKATAARAMDVFGALPQSLTDFQRVITLRINDLNGQFRKAEGNPELQNQIAQQMSVEVQGLHKDLQTRITQVAQTWAGGKKELVPLAQAWLTGQPISGAAAVDGLIAMVRSGNAPGNIKGSARDAFLAAQSAIQNLTKTKGGTDIEDLMRAGTVKPDDLRQAVTGAVESAFGGQASQNVVMRATEIGQTIGHDAGKIPTDAYRQAIVAGDQQGYELMANELNTDADSVKAAFAHGDINAWHKIDPENKYNFNQLASKLQAEQMQGMFHALDATVSPINGAAPSAVLTNLFNDSTFQSRANNIMAASGQSSFGNWLMTSITGSSSFGGGLINYSQAMQLSHSQYTLADTKDMIQNGRQYRNDPLKRLSVALGPIPGINEHEESALLKELVTRTQKPDTPDYRMPGSEMIQIDTGQEYFNALLQTLKSSKFDNPALERIRKIAAAGVDDAITQSDAAIDRYNKGPR